MDNSQRQGRGSTEAGLTPVTQARLLKRQTTSRRGWWVHAHPRMKYNRGLALTSIAEISLVADWYFLSASRSFFTVSDAILSVSLTAERGSRTFKTQQRDGHGLEMPVTPRV